MLTGLVLPDPPLLPRPLFPSPSPLRWLGTMDRQDTAPTLGRAWPAPSSRLPATTPRSWRGSLGPGAPLCKENRGWGGGALFQRSWCSVCLSQGEPGGSSSLSLRGEGAGRALPRCLETCLARTTCAPGVPFQKRLVRPVLREPGNYGGLPGSPKPSQAPDAPSEGRPGPGPDRGSCSPPVKGHPS